MARYDSTGWRIDLDDAKWHIQEMLNGGLSKSVVEETISKWVVYHQDEKNKLIEYLKTI